MINTLLHRSVLLSSSVYIVLQVNVKLKGLLYTDGQFRFKPQY